MTALFLKFEFHFIEQNVCIALSLEGSLSELLLILYLPVKSTVRVKVLSISLIHSGFLVIDD